MLSPSAFLQLARAGFILARERVLAIADLSQAPLHLRAAIAIARLVERRSGPPQLATALTRLGPSWVKLGQFLATRPDIVGMPLARDLESLRDRMPPFSQTTAMAEIETALGAPLARFYSAFSEPVAAASVAQVHKAVRVEDGATVAVKILRPGIGRRFKRDLDAFYIGARILQALDPKLTRLRPVDVVDTLARTTAIEMDLRLEAAALSEMAANTKDDPGFRVPAPDWELTARNVLTLEWVDGTPIADRAALKDQGVDLIALSKTVIQSFLRHAIRDGFFHADMHQGNLFVDRAGNLVAVDFGIMGRAGDKERRFLAEILHGFITRNYRRVAEVHFEAGYVPARYSVADFAQAIRAIGEPIHEKKASEISMAKLLTLLFEITELFDMRTRPELVLLQKTMVVVEGVARELDPDLDMWTTAAPVVREWIDKRFGPLGLLREGADRSAKLVAGLPGLVSRAETLAERLESASETGFTLSPDSIEAIGRAEQRRNRGVALALWALVALALLSFLWG